MVLLKVETWETPASVMSRAWRATPLRQVSRDPTRASPTTPSFVKSSGPALSRDAVWNDLPPCLILQLANGGLRHRVSLLFPVLTPALCMGQDPG